MAPKSQSSCGASSSPAAATTPRSVVGVLERMAANGIALGDVLADSG